jgi:hypothetical protein
MTRERQLDSIADGLVAGRVGRFEEPEKSIRRVKRTGIETTFVRNHLGESILVRRNKAFLEIEW